MTSPRPPLSCSGVVLRVLFHPKQLLLFSGGDDSEVRVWDLVDKSCVVVFKVGGLGWQMVGGGEGMTS